MFGNKINNEIWCLSIVDITIVCVYGEVKKPKIKSLNTIENQIKDDEDAERKKKKKTKKRRRKNKKKNT